MKTLLIILGVLALGGFLLAKTGTFSYYAYSVSQDADGRQHVHCYAGCNTDVVQSEKAAAGGSASPIVQDAVALVEADQSPRFGRAVIGMHRLLTRAGRMAHPAGSALVWRQAPRLAGAIDSEESLLLDRVRAVDLQTSAGEDCRLAALRLVARDQSAVREFEIALAQSEPAWNAIKRFNAGTRAAGKAYIADARPCIAAAPRSDRPQLVDIVRHF